MIFRLILAPGMLKVSTVFFSVPYLVFVLKWNQSGFIPSSRIFVPSLYGYVRTRAGSKFKSFLNIFSALCCRASYLNHADPHYVICNWRKITWAKQADDVFDTYLIKANYFVFSALNYFGFDVTHAIFERYLVKASVQIEDSCGVIWRNRIDIVLEI